MVPENLWKALIQNTLSGVIAILQFIERILGGSKKSMNDVAVLAGLYTFAVEEYGKLLILADLRRTNGEVTIPYRRGIRNHERKFNVAIERLPAVCTGLESPLEEIALEGFAATSLSPVDFEARLAIFYSDFSESLDSVIPVPRAYAGRLIGATSKLLEIALGFRLPWE